MKQQDISVKNLEKHFSTYLYVIVLHVLIQLILNEVEHGYVLTGVR